MKNNKIAINWSIERTWLKDAISHAPIEHASAQPLHIVSVVALFEFLILNGVDGKWKRWIEGE